MSRTSIVKIIRIHTPSLLKLKQLIEPRFLIGLTNRDDLRLDVLVENVPEYKHDLLVLNLLAYKKEIESQIAGITYTYVRYNVVDVKNIITTLEVEYE